MTKPTIYTFSKCDEADGYFLANCECVCTQTCSDKVTSKPEHAKYTTGTCKSCGKTETVTTGWECNDGYHKNSAGTGCEADITESCESKGYSTNKPTSRGYLCKDATVSLNGVNSTCYDCVACEDEYLITSNSCQQICENYGIDAQSRSYYKINTITSLNNRTGGPCYEGRYSIHKSDCCCEGLGAVALADCEEPIEPEDCPAGYASTVGECGSQGVAGWELGAKYGSMNCYECKARTCPIVSVSGFGTGSATRDVKSSTDNRVSSCGSYAGNGWTVVATGKYSGDEQCFVCRPNACPTGYKPGVSSVADCGLKAADGWSFSASNLANGNDPCGLCSKLKCQNGYSSSVSAANCKPGESFTSLGFSGDTPCGKCQISCPEGFTAGLTDPSQCGVGGEDGWFVEFNGNESCGLCTPKTCGDHGLESTRYNTVCLSEKVYIGNDLVDCYDCVGCDTFDIYNSTGSLYDVYRDSIDIPCSEWCRYDKYTPDITDLGIPYLIYKKSVKDKAGRSGDCYGLIDVPGYWEIETNEKKMCCCLYGEGIAPSGCSEFGQ